MEGCNIMTVSGNGKFIISLDFELMWGVRDKRTIETYGKNVEAVHRVIPRLLETFRRFDIKVTFAGVGLLFFENKKELLEYMPKILPKYRDSNLSPYNGYIDTIGEDGTSDPWHYAPRLLELIQSYPEHEIGTHTFSHYYCLEPGVIGGGGGQTVDIFKADLQSALRIAEKRGITLSALVFPRNQYNEEYLRICRDMGLVCYRGNQRSWLYTARNGEQETFFRRALRLLDAYIPVSGHNCSSDEYLKSMSPVDIPASRFLRPYSKKLAAFEGLRLRRITSDMTYSAKRGMTYHLWWHPHNFGVNEEKNFSVLEKILGHYQYLNRKYHFQNMTMSELAKGIRIE